MKITGNILQTPEDRFEDLKDYPFASNYMDLNGVKMHYLEEGKGNLRTIFLFHGQPTWSYLYRKMIPLLVEAGFHVIAPDLIGFGKSDKPENTEMHTYSNHVEWMQLFVRKMGIQNAIAFMQDWGGMIGLRVLAENPNWLDHLIVSNTALAEVKGIGKWIFPKVMHWMANSKKNVTVSDFKENQNFKYWAGYFSNPKHLEIGEIVQILTTYNLSEEEKLAYDAPFLNKKYEAGPRTMPRIIATDLNEVNEAWRKLKEWKKPVLTLFSDKDPFLAKAGYDKKFQKNFKGAKNQPHDIITNASHFLQEDQPEMLVDFVVKWLSK
ncbi:haloalkane dehalogenase [Aureivirga sp. CE67]|uniref:haloalkane dehalogenase n=1 Tax=Aureivirga sp. CE67 TaxID=1788983 RepID=UPI0018C9884F|nr:haloalkane dehalogenase [Aureivirga sp. CE67]